MNNIFQPPDDEFWHRMFVFPAKINGINDQNLVQKTIVKFPATQLKKIFELMTGRDITADKEDLAFIIATQPDFFDLARSLYILEQFLTLVTLSTLEKIAEKENLEIPKSKSGAALEVFIHNYELLAVARLLSLSNRRSKRTHYILEGLDSEFSFQNYLGLLTEQIEDDISSPEKRARFDDPIIEENNILLSVKYEKSERKVEEFDNWHYDKPASWVILELDPSNEILSLKGEKNVFASSVVKTVSRVLTGRIEPPEEMEDPDISSFNINIDENITDILETQEEFQSEEFHISTKKWRSVAYADTPLAGNPTLIIKGEHISEAVNELKDIHNLDFTQSDPSEFTIEITYNYNGMEKSVFLTKKFDTDIKFKFERSISQQEEYIIRKNLTEIFKLAIKPT
ncbi:MAG: hypothetical protein ACXADY_09890 [Candidatus Hodarchaeales archaeon]|jgi:hypothetical protein